MRRCPSCGKIETEKSFAKNFCRECFAQHFELAKLPSVVEVIRCSVCGRIRVGNEWVEENKRALGELIAQNFKPSFPYKVREFELRGGPRNRFNVGLDVEFNVDGAVITLPFETIMKFVQVQCADCSRESGGYFDSIIQLRSKDVDNPFSVEKMEAKIKKLDKLLAERGGYIRKVEQTVTGLDVYIAGITPAMQASHILSDNIKHTRKLVGRKKGKELYRHTFCVRL